MHFEPPVDPPRDRQQLHGVAEFRGVTQVEHVERVKALADELGRLDAAAEREPREQAEFLGGVGAVDVHRRVGFGVAELLGLADDLGEGPGGVGHRAEDVVAGSVENRLDANDFVRRQPLR